MGRVVDRQIIGFTLAALACAGGTLALGADGALASYAGGGALCAAALIAGVAARPPLVFWLGLGVLGWLAAANAFAGTLWVAGPELAAMAGIAGAFACGVQAGSDPERVKRAAVLLTLGLGGLALVAFVGHVAEPSSVLGQPKPYHQDRLTGTFLSANTAATMCGLGLALGLAGLARAVRGSGGFLRGLEAAGRGGLAPGALVLFAAACLLLTGSRAGLLAALFGAAVVLAPKGGLRGIRLPALAAGAGVLTILLASSGGIVGDRLIGLGAGDNGRAALWQASLAAWRDAPILGHGLGTFSRALAAQVTLETAPSLGIQGAAHNLPLQWLVQTGLVGTGLGLVALASLVRLLVVGLGRRRGRWIVGAALGALGVFLMHGLVDYAFEVPAATWWLALLCGLGAGVATAPKHVTERRQSPR